MTDPKDYYRILGIAPDADSEQIKKAYRGLARQYHPDMRPNDPQAIKHFKEINEAYHTLIKPERRAAYDTLYQQQWLIAYPRKPTVISSAPDKESITILRLIFVGFAFILILIAIQVVLIVHFTDTSEQNPTLPQPTSTRILPSESKICVSLDLTVAMSYPRCYIRNRFHNLSKQQSEIECLTSNLILKSVPWRVHPMPYMT